MPQGLARRRFLQVGLAGGALLALGGLALSPGQPTAASSTLKVLSARELAVLAAIAERLCPGGDGLPAASEIGVAGKVDAFLDGMDPWTVADVRKLLGLFESRAGGLLLDGRWRPFTELSLAERDAALDGWRRSRLAFKRAAWLALRGLVVSQYWADPRVYVRLGYPGPPSFGRSLP